MYFNFTKLLINIIKIALWLIALIDIKNSKNNCFIWQ